MIRKTPCRKYLRDLSRGPTALDSLDVSLLNSIREKAEAEVQCSPSKTSVLRPSDGPSSESSNSSFFSDQKLDTGVLSVNLIDQSHRFALTYKGAFHGDK